MDDEARDESSRAYRLDRTPEGEYSRAHRQTPTAQADEITRERTRKLRIENDLRERRLIPRDHVQAFLDHTVDQFDDVLQGEAERIADGDDVLRSKLDIEHRRIAQQFRDALRVG